MPSERDESDSRTPGLPRVTIRLWYWLLVELFATVRRFVVPLFAMAIVMEFTFSPAIKQGYYITTGFWMFVIAADSVAELDGLPPVTDPRRPKEGPVDE